LPQLTSTVLPTHIGLRNIHYNVISIRFESVFITKVTPGCRQQNVVVEDGVVNVDAGLRGAFNGCRALLQCGSDDVAFDC